MLNFLTTVHPKETSTLIVAASMLLSACSIVGVRSGTEQPLYSVIGKVSENVELRQYQNRLTAKVSLPSTSGVPQNRNAAFSILADYIFGGNRSNSTLAMTAPVAAPISSESIAMTAPVAADTGNDGPYGMSFFLPRNYTPDTAPVPNDPRIELIEVPATKMAALRFSGNRDERSVEVFKAKLLKELTSSDWQVVGEPVAYFYDPPWTIPSMRRNEVAVSVEPKASDHIILPD